MDSDVASQLGGFALGEVLSSLQLDLDQNTIGAVQGQLGIGSAAFSRDSIYKGKFVDDVDDDEEDGQDLEAEVDREMYDEKYRKATTSGTTKAGGGRTLMRGEEDDYDDDDDDDDEGDAAGKSGAATPAVRIKDEPMDEDEGLFGSSDGDDDHRQREDDDRDRQMSVDTIPPPPPMRQIDVKDLFPSFEAGKILDFTDLFSTRPHKRVKKAFPVAKLAIPTPDELPRTKSTRDALVAPLRPLPSSKEHRSLKALLVDAQEREREEWEDEGDSDEELIKAIERSNRTTKAKWHLPSSISSVDPAIETLSAAFSNPELDSWEDSIIWDATSPPLRTSNPSPLAPRNANFEQGDWLKSIIWDGHQKSWKEFEKLELNLNDTRMVLEVVEREEEEGDGVTSKVPTIPRAPGLDFFNLSNDKEYEVTKDTKKRIRQTFGFLEVQHAYPAQKLQLPFYKTRLTKSDARSFHRPALQFPSNVPISFTKVKSNKKKKDKATGRKIKKSDATGESLRSMSDVTLRDNSNFILWEFSEENPPIISNVGMGSILVNYYRKRDATDDFIPQLDLGEPLLLEGTDESPFKAFGSVNPGQTVPTLYNNLIRAPLFRHKPYTTDFLVVRNTIKGETLYFLRNLKTNFVVGQTYPINEVPGPHSRKVTTLVKNRLQTIAFKLVNKEPHHRIKVQQLTRYFPDQNDLQMRQRLKEFMEFNRKGDNQGYWVVKKHIPIPDDSEMLKMATPEQVCLAESMQVGLRHLQDAGFSGEKVEEGGTGDDDSKLDIEQQLAPWITTKNFINATANKAMLKLHGEGDPTGRGEAFSFLRVSMKDIFLRDGESMEERLAEMKERPKSAHRYNVQEQQDVYKEEIARIWKAQYTSLSNPVEPLLTQEDEDRSRNRNRRGVSMAAETPHSIGTPFGRAGTPGSRASSPDKDDGMSIASGRGRTKVLKIRRLVKGVWETEIVRDQGTIQAYVRQRQTIDDERTDADDLMPSDDVGKNERRKKRLKEQLEKLKRNQERRLARKNQKMGIPNGAIGLDGKRAMRPETTRVCGNCGQRGHMKTSKKLCPRWHEFNAPKEVGPSTALPSSFGGGLALPMMGQVATPSAASPPANKPIIKLKLGGAMSPEASSE